MKYLLPLAIAGSAAWAGTRDTAWDVRQLWREPPQLEASAPLASDPPWLTGALDRDPSEMAMDDVADVTEVHSGMCPREDMDGDDAAWEGAADPHGSFAADDSFADDPHGSVLSAAADVAAPTAPLPRSVAANGYSIAELVAQREALAERNVRVRGVVVKKTEGVLDKTYLHLRDGTGSLERGDHDLTVTTAERFELGETVEVEGHVLVDQDLGLGYRYAVLLDASRRIRSPGPR
jgi:hypothetical protein